ncbi:hypothetical protein Tco_1509810 [Tanacetum coccineum]
MNANVQKFNQLVTETLVHSGENDDDWMTRVKILFKTHTCLDFKHKSVWLFLKNKYKWKNLESTLARRNHLRVTDEESEHFGDDVLPRPPGLQRISKSQRSGSNSTASSGSTPMMYQKFMKEQYELDCKAKNEGLIEPPVGATGTHEYVQGRRLVGSLVSCDTSVDNGAASGVTPKGWDCLLSTAFGGNTHDLGSFGEETDKTTDLHQNLLKIMLTERGDSVASIKRRRHDLRNDGVSTLVTPSEHGRPKGTLEDSVPQD